MDRLAGQEAALLPPDWEEASSTISGTDADEAALTAAQVRAWGLYVILIEQMAGNVTGGNRRRLQSGGCDVNNSSRNDAAPLCLVIPAGPTARRAGSGGGAGAQHRAAGAQT